MEQKIQYTPSMYRVYLILVRMCKLTCFTFIYICNSFLYGCRGWYDALSILSILGFIRSDSTLHLSTVSEAGELGNIPFLSTDISKAGRGKVGEM